MSQKLDQGKTNTTRERMIRTAFDLFHRNGFQKTSVDDILEATQTGKSQFYHYFGSKDGLIEQVLDYVTIWAKNEPVQTPYQFDITSWQALDQWFRFFIEMAEKDGCEKACPIMTIGYDLGDDNPALRQKVNALMEFTQSRIERFLKSEKTAGRLNGDPQSLSSLCMSTVHGGLMISRLRRNIMPLQEAVSALQNQLQSLRIANQ